MATPPFNKLPPPPPATQDIGVDPAWHTWFRQIDNGKSIFTSVNSWTGIQYFTGGIDLRIAAALATPNAFLLRDASLLSGGTQATLVSNVLSSLIVGASDGYTESGFSCTARNSSTTGLTVGFYSYIEKWNFSANVTGAFFSTGMTSGSNLGSQKSLHLQTLAGGAGGTGTRYGALFEFLQISGGVAPTFDYGLALQGDGVAQLIQACTVRLNCTQSAFSLGNAATAPIFLDITAAGTVGSLVSLVSTNSVYTAAVLGAYKGKVKVQVDGTTYYLPIYN